MRKEYKRCITGEMIAVYVVENEEDEKEATRQIMAGVGDANFSFADYLVPDEEQDKGIRPEDLPEPKKKGA